MFNTNKRILFINFLIIIASVIIISRYFYIQILKYDELSQYLKRESERNIKEIMPRGEIYDKNGRLLACSIVKWDVVIMKNEFDYKDNNISILSEILNIPSRKIKEKLNQKKNYIKIKKFVEKDIYDKLIALQIKGVLLEPHQTRIYPLDSAKEIIGVSNENNGLTQLELVMDRYLKGNVIVKDVIKDNKGNIMKIINEVSEKKPAKIYLTIDYQIQSFLENTLEKYFHILNAKNIIAIVENAQNGFIEAAASYPPNYVNFKPFEFVYEPGSTFKSIILAAGFEENIIKEDDVFDCENGKWKINSKYIITDHEPLGKLKLVDIYTHSSNIGFAKIGIKIGIDKIYPYIKKFGFGLKYTQFPGESKGIIKDFKSYRDVDTMTTSYGYGIAVTPLQLVNAYTAIANNGNLLKPQIVSKIDDDGKITKYEKEEIRNVISMHTAERIKKIMIKVVEEGTGINAQIPGYYIGGKTGTSNKLDPKTLKYVKGENIASFCGFLTAKNPSYVILIIVDSSKKYKYGGQAAAPIFREIAKQIINIKNIRPEKEIDYSSIKEKKEQIILN